MGAPDSKQVLSINSGNISSNFNYFKHCHKSAILVLTTVDSVCTDDIGIFSSWQ